MGVSWTNVNEVWGLGDEINQSGFFFFFKKVIKIEVHLNIGQFGIQLKSLHFMTLNL